jgi:uncharacterized lipoprotein YmbA
MTGSRYVAYGAVILAALAGCASIAETRFYTLSGSPGLSEARDSSSPLSSGPIFIDVMPVNVPERLARPQLVVRSRGQAPQLFILEQDRWSSHFNHELRDAFVTQIASRTGAINETRGSRMPGQTGYRIAVELGQFDAVVGEAVNARFAWTITRTTDGRGAACYSEVAEQVGGGIDGVVEGVRRAVSRVAAEISRTLVELDTGQAAACSPRRGQ